MAATESNCIEDGMDTDLRKPFQVGYERAHQPRPAASQPTSHPESQSLKEHIQAGTRGT